MSVDLIYAASKGDRAGGARICSDAPDVSGRLSELMQRHVTLQRRPPAVDAKYYRRREPGAALAGRLARYRPGRRLLQWTLVRGDAAKELRETFGREPDEPLPDFADVPGSIFEFQTPPGTYFDLYPIHVLTSSTLQRLAALNPVIGEMPTIRCAMPMHAQADLPRDASVVRTIVRDSNQCVGLYGSVATPGRITNDDPVEVSGSSSES